MEEVGPSGSERLRLLNRLQRAGGIADGEPYPGAGRQNVSVARYPARQLLGKRLRIRHAPEISFVRDDSIDRTLKLTKLIDDLAKERKARETEVPAKPEEE